MSNQTQSDTAAGRPTEGRPPEDTNVRIDDITKVFEESDGGEVVAVEDLSIDIRKGEFLVLVGPSGCGKTTTLRTVAGLESPTEGAIRIQGMDVTELDPRERDISMVFQNYALYPHKTVRENISFPLEVRSFPKDETERRVEEAADLLGITELLDRKPSALSGGQQQRVALGRAIVREPAVFLMDEPLSNLDAKLRVQMRTELNELHKRVGKTTIYVTHDQAEAMTLGDRIAVMNDGQLQQIGPPQQLYDRPTNRFVAGFIGEPPMNFLPAELDSTGDGYRVRTEAFDFDLPREKAALLDESGRSPDSVTLGVRPEDIDDASLVESGPNRARFEPYVKLTEPMGSDKFLTLTPEAGEGQELTARVSPDSDAEEDETTTLSANLEKVHLFDDRTGDNLTR
ncbi:ABC transporter ATP-binding protein [Halobium salinum]|uniref:ABC-type D-xylose/L-arabinose transporter n=1 Tax=Halobium salinum TaxID=1364940 RepID=A0ABD5PI34_9EURY|nr:ABC transporter ATP-binding protein [Halobium salinum]